MNSSSKKRFAPHGYLGILVIVVAEGLLFSGNQLVGHWFTPIVWTGYILFVDALLYKFSGRSPLMTDRLELLLIAVLSIGIWWLCEFYNAPRFWKSDLELWWHYHNLEPNPFLRRVGYDWAFATIFPLLFLTAELFRVLLFKKKGGGLTIRLSQPILIALALLGAVGAIVPLLYPSAWFAPVIWLSLIFLFDPLNALRGQPSIFNDLSHGDWRRLWSLLLSGLLCGVLWEFWNYWAISKWTYTVPFLGNVKIFEMPVLGFLGFPPFAVECWVMYIFLRSLLQPQASETNGDGIFVHPSTGVISK
ncbi:MAG: hypothetical protein QOG23_2627 [Blastocatellia bacterium]|jgi:hypothetical protein|nr:hypothetical protein [Blastocatellia bacterium]